MLLHVIDLRLLQAGCKFDMMTYKTKIRWFISVLLTCCIGPYAYAQSGSGVDLPDMDMFVGSTPCDSVIRSVLKIQPDVKCDFIKWDLSLNKTKADTGAFQCIAWYGESKPNTNGFIGGGEKILVAGKYSMDHRVNENRYLNLYQLDGYNLRSSLFLIKMDSNILHFADSNKNLIIGNGGFGYVLNRIK